jgi:hypothetical protein
MFAACSQPYPESKFGGGIKDVRGFSEDLTIDFATEND